MKLPNYNIYHTTHPDEIAHGGTAVLIRQNIKHHARAEYKQNNIQVTSISLEDNIGEITILRSTAPQNNNKYEDYDHFFKTLGNRFLVGGDFNTKHTLLGIKTQKYEKKGAV